MLYIGILNLVFLLLLILFFKMMADRRYRYKTFKRLIDHINVGYYRYRLKDGILLMANRGFFDILELDISPAEATGRSLSEFLIYVEGEGSISERLREWNELRNHEFHFKTLQGRDKWVLHNSYITKDPLSKEDVVEALIEDITEEKVSYEKMRNSQERYEKLFMNSGDMVIIYKFDDLSIEEVNPITQVLSGF
ncbi:MAG: PAS domain S-box protein, partial [Candidatus Omnitrophica bacterium]|nr:PAS domain S-box protein [Candidatus Omnitrophota bacterium]